MRSTIPTALLALSLLVAACGDDDGSTDTTDPPTPAAPTTTGAASAQPAVVIDGFEFVDVADVVVGQEVVVENRDATNHTWTASDGTFNSGPIPGGDTFTFVFDEPGEYRFFCDIHPTMSGSITVTG